MTNALFQIVGQFGTGQFSTEQFGTRQFSTGQIDPGQFGTGQFGTNLVLCLNLNSLSTSCRIFRGFLKAVGRGHTDVGGVVVR